MRNLLAVIPVLFLVLACKTSIQNEVEYTHIGDKIFADIENDYGNTLSRDTLTDGTLVYTFYLNGTEYLAQEKSLIGYIDKTLEKVPDETKEGQMSSRGDHLYNTYLWNTPLITVDIQSSFYYSNDSIYVRIFMNKK